LNLIIYDVEVIVFITNQIIDKNLKAQSWATLNIRNCFIW